MKECHLDFFKSFFDISNNNVETEYIINSHTFYIKQNIMFCHIHNMKYPLIVIGDYIWINFENDAMKYFKIILPYLLELKIDFFYLTYHIFQEYPTKFFTTTTTYNYFDTIYRNIFLHDKYYNNGNNHMYNHYVYYNNKNKLIKFFEKHNFNWKVPLYKLIEIYDKRDSYFRMINNYIRNSDDAIAHEMGEYDKYLRTNKLNEMMKMFESDEFNA